MNKYLMAILMVLGLTVPPEVFAGGDRTKGPQPAPVNVTVPEYRLGFGDVIEVKFFNNERFNETVKVRPDGRISMERMGEIFVTGLTPLELDSLITLKYSEFIQQPEVTVILREFGGSGR
ncbi:MAG: polysaccharide biosynthesis/export family protein [Candidatus Glassbacteria bacterium]